MFDRSKEFALPRWRQASQGPWTSHPREWMTLIGAVAIALLWLSWPHSGETQQRSNWSVITHSSDAPTTSQLPLQDIPRHLKKFQKCAINNLRATNLTFLDTAYPLEVTEFASRRDRLAQALVDDGMNAFIVEPGYTFSYFANVSQSDWEVWEPEERPFLMLIQPMQAHDVVSNEDIIRANTSFLVPSFEAERARTLNMPFLEKVELVTYEEHWNPYKTLLDSLMFPSQDDRKQLKVTVDEEMRDFISRGLEENGFNVSGLRGAVERVRQKKSAIEIEILRAVNTGTVESLRAMRKCMTPGLTEHEVMLVLDNTLRSAGLDPFFDIVLFDENAASPHGGTDGTKRLQKETMVLVDVGAHLYGYSSDICRSFFPPFFDKPATERDLEALSESVREKLRVWDVVFDAQTASLYALHENGTCASVDLAAREVIDRAGYGSDFTHRVGHGIGIKAHESPYLNKGNVHTQLKAGMTFTSEPGVYLVDKFGIRHEDVLLVRDEGLPEILTKQRAKGPWEP